jgi:hypothetical protein
MHDDDGKEQREKGKANVIVTKYFQHFSQIFYSKCSSNPQQNLITSLLQTTTTMKRSYQHDDDTDASIALPMSESMALPHPAVIEPDECLCRSAKRARTCDCSSLNLLVEAIENVASNETRQQRHQQQAQQKTIVDKVPSMFHEIVLANSSNGTPASSNASTGAPSSIFDDVSSSFCGEALLPPLPKGIPMGKPLMAPPRLPTNLMPGQILLSKAKGEKHL